MSLQKIPPDKAIAPSEKEPPVAVEDYALKIHNQAVEDTLESAKKYQLAFWLLMSVAVILVENSVRDKALISWDTLWSILIVYVGTILLSFIINLFRAPRKLDSKRQLEIDLLNSRTAKLEEAHRREIEKINRNHQANLEDSKIKIATYEEQLKPKIEILIHQVASPIEGAELNIMTGKPHELIEINVEVKNLRTDIAIERVVVEIEEVLMRSRGKLLLEKKMRLPLVGKPDQHEDTLDKGGRALFNLLRKPTNGSLQIYNVNPDASPLQHSYGDMELVLVASGSNTTACRKRLYIRVSRRGTGRITFN